jgi:hypothetical protein
MDLYNELAASVTSAEPDHANFVFLANMVRLGQTRKAVESLERLVANEALPAEVPREAVWRVLGFAYFLDLKEPGRAQFALEQANKEFEARERKQALMQQAGPGDRLARRLLSLLQPGALEEDSARWESFQMGNQLTSSTLGVLRTGREDLITAFRAALRTRLGADVQSTIAAWGNLLRVGADSPEVRREYMRALNGFEREVYYFSPSQRPFRPTRAQRAAFLEQFLRLAGETAEADQARLELFLVSIESRNFDRARGLLQESLQKDGDRAVEGIPEAFEDFLEKPETQPWLEAAMTGVFLEASMRDRIRALLQGPEPQMLMALAAVKSALLRGDVDLARREADLAAGIYGQVLPEERSPRLRHLHARLLAMRAREASLRGLFGEAVTQLQAAEKSMLEAATDDVEYLMEVRFQAALLADRLGRGATAELTQRIQRESERGDDLVAPNWEISNLRASVREAVDEYDKALTEDGVRRWIAAYDYGIAMGKLRRLDASHAALDEVASAVTAPFWLRSKALLELAALEELQDDPFNAARRWAQLAVEDDQPEYVRAWLGFRIAKAHLRIRHRVGEALAALSAIEDRFSGTGLAIQAAELLRTAQTGEDESGR